MVNKTNLVYKELVLWITPRLFHYYYFFFNSQHIVRNVSKTEACFSINQKYNSPLSLVEFCDGVHNFVFVAPIVDWSIYIYTSVMGGFTQGILFHIATTHCSCSQHQ